MCVKKQFSRNLYTSCAVVTSGSVRARESHSWRCEKFSTKCFRYVWFVCVFFCSSFFFGYFSIVSFLAMINVCIKTMRQILRTQRLLTTNLTWWTNSKQIIFSYVFITWIKKLSALFTWEYVFFCYSPLEEVQLAGSLRLRCDLESINSKPALT